MGALGVIASHVLGEVVKAKLSREPVPYDAGKSMFASKTVWGAIIMALGPLVISRLGINETEFAALAHVLDQAIGFALVYWGRMTAEQAIGPS